MNLFQRLFPKAAELQAAQDRIAALEVDKEELTKRNATLWHSYQEHDATVIKQRTELSEVKAKLREQTDADLLLVSARIIAATLKGEKPAQADIQLQQNLLAQQQMGRQSYEPYGLLGQLGLGGAFFR